LYSGKNGEIQRIGDFCLIFNEFPNMSEPAAAIVPAATNGNGKPAIAPSLLPNLSAVQPPTENAKPTPKVSNSTNARNYIRKPQNKK
jgi:hypothetical protein